MFAPIYGEIYSGVVELARTSAGPPLDWPQRFLIRRAYRFRPQSSTPAPPTTETLIKEAVADLIALVEAGRVQEFEAQLKGLADLHIFLFEIAEVPESDGTSFNYAQMEGLGPWTVGLKWATEYRDLFARATAKLAHEPSFFHNCAYLGSRIYAGVAKTTPPAALRSIIDVSFNLFFRLREWAASAHKLEGGTPGHAGLAFELQPRSKDIYADAWRSFVAGWERLPSNFYGGLTDRGERGWTELVSGHELLQTHLQNTALMVGASAWSGDLLAVRWSTDLLLRWFELSKREWGDYIGARRDWILDTVLITTDLLAKPWPEVAVLPLMRFEGEQPQERDVYSAAIENVWRDIQLALVCVLIRWASAAGANGAATIAARSLLRHEVFDAAAITDQAAPFGSVDDALESILRVVASGGRFSESYATTIGGVVSKLIDLTKEPWVSQRIYSSWGLQDTYGFPKERVLALATLVPNGAGPTASLSAGITGMLRRASDHDDEGARRLLDHLKELRDAADALDRTRDAPLITALRRAPSDASFDDWRRTTKSLIVACIEALTVTRDERIRTAPIDPARLAAIAAAASKTAFAKETAAFPIGHFEEIKRTTDPLNAWTFRLRHPKGEVTQPMMARPVSNEESWWAETIRNYVGAIVLHDLITAAPIEEVRADTPESWWDAVKVAARSIEQTSGKALLVVASLVAPVWLIDWTWNVTRPGRPARPPDLRVWRSESDTEPAYELHFNDIAVFRAQIEQTCSYVIPAAMFRRIEFTNYPQGTPVFVEFEDDPAGDPWSGILKATLARRVTLGDGKIVRIRFADESPVNSEAS